MGNLIYGVGVNDADYVVQKYEEVGTPSKRSRKLVWICPFYQKWTSMLCRCYSDKFKQKNKSYDGCKVSDEWLTFSNFKNWMEKQDWEGKELDKDLLGNGKIYSPQTCLFISKSANILAQYNAYNLSFRFKNRYQVVVRDMRSGRRKSLGVFNQLNCAISCWLSDRMVAINAIEDNKFIKELIWEKISTNHHNAP